MTAGVCVGLTLLLGVELTEGDTGSQGAGSAFTTVEIQGNANLNAGNIAGSGSGEANSSIGVYAETDAGFSIIAAFSFESKGTSIAAGTVRDYAAFLEQPTSTLGGQVKLQWSWRKGPWLRYGLAGNSRVFSVDMSFGDGGASQRINLIASDPSFTLSALLDEHRKLSVAAELGMATRIWNKPGLRSGTS